MKINSFNDLVFFVTQLKKKIDKLPEGMIINIPVTTNQIHKITNQYINAVERQHKVKIDLPNDDKPVIVLTYDILGIEINLQIQKDD